MIITGQFCCGAVGDEEIHFNKTSYQSHKPYLIIIPVFIHKYTCVFTHANSSDFIIVILHQENFKGYYCYYLLLYHRFVHRQGRYAIYAYYTNIMTIDSRVQYMYLLIPPPNYDYSNNNIMTTTTIQKRCIVFRVDMVGIL